MAYTSGCGLIRCTTMPQTPLPLDIEERHKISKQATKTRLCAAGRKQNRPCVLFCIRLLFLLIIETLLTT